MPISNLEALSYILVHLHDNRFTDVFTFDEMLEAAKKLKTDILQPPGSRSPAYVKKALVDLKNNELIEFIDTDQDRFCLTDGGKERIKEVRKEYPLPPAHDVDTTGPGVQRTPRKITTARKSISASPREVMKRGRCYRRRLTMSPAEIIEARNELIAKLEQQLLATGATPNLDNGNGMEVDGDTSGADNTMISQSPSTPQMHPDLDMPDLEPDLPSSDAGDTSSIMQPDSDWEHDNDNDNGDRDDDTAVQINFVPGPDEEHWPSTSTPVRRRPVGFDPDQTLVNTSRGKGKQRAYADDNAAAANADDAKQVLELTKTIKTLERRLEEKQVELNAARGKKDTARGDHAAPQTRFDASTRHWASTVFRDCAKLVSARLSARTQTEQRAAAVARLETSVDALTAELNECNAQIQQLTAGNQALTAQVAHLTTGNEHLTTQNAELTTANGQLTTANTYLTTQNSHLTAQNAHLTAENAELTKELGVADWWIEKTEDKIKQDAAIVSNLFSGMFNMMQGAASRLNVSSGHY